MIAAITAIAALAANAAAAAISTPDASKRCDHPWLVQKFQSVDASLWGALCPMLEFQLGTPPQTVYAAADTGSWAPYLVAPGYWHYTSYPTDNLFNSSLSSTFHLSQDRRESGWSSDPNADHSNDYYKGNWSSDVSTIGDGSSFNFTFDYSDPKWGTPLVGIDPYQLADDDPEAQYTILRQLKNHGVINEFVFALYYDDIDAYTGELTFGAVDTSKYIGDLVEIPYQSTFSFGNYSYYNTQNNGLDTYVKKLLGDTVLHQMFDTGSYLFGVAGAAYDQLNSDFGDGKGNWDYAKLEEYNPFVDITFGGVFNISYPILENFNNAVTKNLHQLPLQRGFSNQGPQLYRYAYVVWDYERHRMLLGKRNPNPGPRNLKLVSEL